jgi:hypothetical protein
MQTIHRIRFDFSSSRQDRSAENLIGAKASPFRDAALPSLQVREFTRRVRGRMAAAIRTGQG